MIAHLDVDCFFAQVEEVRLSLRGRPLGVQQNAEIAAVNYEARAFGLYNRISVTEGLRRCANLVLVRGDNGINGMQRYRLASQGVLRVIMRSLDAVGLPTFWVGRLVEQASFDDFFVQLPDGLASAEAASHWANELRTAVLLETGLRCSVGLARTKLLTMLATKRAKPNGLHCCVGAASEAELLDSARIDRICGAGMVGLRPSARTALQQALGEGATLGAARKWRERDRLGVAAALGAAEADALGLLLERACDGSGVASFSLPRGLSVECSVRPSEHEPATSAEDLRRGFAHLAPMLLSRAADDAATYGKRRPAHLIVKWKLFPSAREVRQVQTAWPHSASSEASAEAIAALALRTFEGAVRNQPFRVSRAVLAIAYADGAAGAAGAAGTGGAVGAAGKRKRAEAGQTSLLQFVNRAGTAARPSTPLSPPATALAAAELACQRPVLPSAPPSEGAAAEAPRRTAGGSSFAACPVCGDSVPLVAMNAHLDTCLRGDGPAPGDEPATGDEPAPSAASPPPVVAPPVAATQARASVDPRTALVAEWERLTRHALPTLAAHHGGWPIVHDHCFMRVALDAAFGGCWYEHLDRRKGPAIGQIATADLESAVAAARRMEVEGVRAVRELNGDSLRWRARSKACEQGASQVS